MFDLKEIILALHKDCVFLYFITLWNLLTPVMVNVNYFHVWMDFPPPINILAIESQSERSGWKVTNYIRYVVQDNYKKSRYSITINDKGPKII